MILRDPGEGLFPQTLCACNKGDAERFTITSGIGPPRQISSPIETSLAGQYEEPEGTGPRLKKYRSSSGIFRESRVFRNVSPPHPEGGLVALKSGRLV